jgi:hypothetical protein
MLEHRYPGSTQQMAYAGSYDLLGSRVANEMFGAHDDADEEFGFLGGLFSKEGRIKRLKKRWLKKKKMLESPRNEKHEERLERQLERIEEKLEKLDVDTDELEEEHEAAMAKAAALTESMGWYGTLPVAAQGAVQLQPVVAAGIDTGTVQLAPLAPQPSLTPGAEHGIEMGFAEFMKEYETAR